ncbi:MAG: ArsR family transcriptional regulator [Firmicutes bacterium]|jgi:predicted transcriptional regulator|nr:ArsR family transcriptional regulator [Bacillota bacterium]HQD39479.1 ArsR family transcriptional regulator [Bacillota bacterium]
MKIEVAASSYPFFAALASETRLKIINLLAEKPLNIGQLAESLDISGAIVTRHINLLEEAGIVKTESITGKRGRQKLCSLAAKQVLLLFPSPESSESTRQLSIPVGQFVAHSVQPTCGLASTDGLIGICDDPRYFSDPDRTKAAIVWFRTGWLEYSIPSYLFSRGEPEQFEISLEICSEHPGYNEDWPSDIHFYLNDKLVGYWTSPGDFGAKGGIYTPSWWQHGTKHGLLKTLKITQEGSFLDGVYLSSLTIADLGIEPHQDLKFRIAVPEDAKNPGGINLFGKGFGNYNQDIEVRVQYR